MDCDEDTARIFPTHLQASKTLPESCQLICKRQRLRQNLAKASSTKNVYYEKDILGTIVNTVTIIIGGAIGATLRRGLGEKYRKVMFDALGLSCLVLGANASLSNMPKSEFPVLFIASLVIGVAIGTKLDWAGRLERYQAKHLKDNGKPMLLQGLTTGCLLYCIGTFSIVGPVLSALSPSCGWAIEEPLPTEQDWRSQ